MATAKQPTRAQVVNAAHILENFAKKGMVGYSPEQTKAVSGGAVKKKTQKKPAAKKTAAKKTTQKKKTQKKQKK